MNKTDWTVIEAEFDPAHLHSKETVFALGNGYLTTRGTFEEGYPGAWPATLIHGVFDDIPIYYTELANCPDPLALSLLVNGERFRLDRGEVLHYERCLDLHEGLLSRDVRWRSPAGLTVDLHFERFASLVEPHVVALRCTVTPLDFDGAIEFRAGLNGYPDNQGLAHWQVVDQGESAGTVWLHCRTRHSSLDLGMAMALSVQGGGRVARETMMCEGIPGQSLACQGRQGKTLTLTKVVTLFSSWDREEPQEGVGAAVAATDPPVRREPVELARAKLGSVLERQPAYQKLVAMHRAAWAEMWRTCDLVVEGDPEAQLAIRYNLFQILGATPRADDRVSISAKTLSGFGYRGHVFWDTDIFIVPFLTLTQPALARNLLGYRYHTLPGARRKAKQNGFEGAMFAWESAATGDEVTPRWVPGPQGEELVRIWTGDIELHIIADVAYAAWKYWQWTGDDDWMRRCGAEILLDTAVFWGSRAEWNATRGRYEICDVIGPDENHEHIDNSAFTNGMVQWHLKTALDVLAWLRGQDAAYAADLERRLDLNPDRLRWWADIIGCIAFLADPETGLIEEFEGFFDLEDINWAEYEARTKSLQAIFGIEGTNRRQILKQADVLMLIYLLGDRFDRQTLQTNWDYYAPRTDHTYGSSLGPAIHALLAAELGKRDEAYEHFMRAALVDLDDVRGNTADGIHAGSAGGLWQAVVFGFGGLDLSGAKPKARPRLPAHWSRLRFRLQYRGRKYRFDLKQPRSAVIPGSATLRVRESRPSYSAERSDAAQRGERGSGNVGEEVPDLKGVIFDLDGVLTDTSEYHYLGWKRLADEESIPFDRKANEALRGVSRRESLMLLLGGRPATEEQIQEMMERKNRYYQEFLEDVTPADLMPGALDLLDDLHNSGIKVAIGSASKNARTVIDKLGLGDRVDALADGYSVQRAKPAPDLFLYAAKQLKLAPEQCIVVEDAASGVEAALAAGMWAVGLGPAERVGAAHVVLPSLAGVRWADLRSRLLEAAKAQNDPASRKEVKA